MKLRLVCWLVIMLLMLGLAPGMEALPRTQAQEGAEERCADPATRADDCLGLSQLRFSGGLALGRYPVPRNPLLELQIDPNSFPSPRRLYVDQFVMLGSGDANADHCRLLLVAFATSDEQYVPELDYMPGDSVRVFAFCRDINLIQDDGQPIAGKPPFPTNSTVLDVQTLVPLDGGDPHTVALHHIVERATAAGADACANSLHLDEDGQALPLTLSDFTVQLAVFLTYWDTVQAEDQITLWRLEQAGIPYIETIRGNNSRDLGCLMQGTSFALPQPSPTPTNTFTPTPTPTNTPTPTHTPTPTITPTLPPPLERPTIPTGTGHLISISDLAVLLTLFSGVGITVIVLTRNRRFRLVVLIVMILIMVGVLVRLVILPPAAVTDEATTPVLPAGTTEATGDEIAAPTTETSTPAATQPATAETAATEPAGATVTRTPSATSLDFTTNTPAATLGNLPPMPETGGDA